MINRAIRVNELIEQIWCEKKLDLTLKYGSKKTPKMAMGKQIHEEMKAKGYVELKAKPVNFADYLFKIGYEAISSIKMLKDSGVCRELSIYGSYNGLTVSGKIDEIDLQKGLAKVVELKTGKVPASNGVFALHRMQAFIYRKMLEDLRNGNYRFDLFSKFFRIENLKVSKEFEGELKSLEINENLEEVYKYLFEEFRDMPELSNNVEIRYIDEDGVNGSVEIEYSEKDVNEMFEYLKGYWLNEREAQPVKPNETWKCNICEFFGNKCKVYYKGN
ncbi:MAG: PD-(D/E)XK nuclease family protein [Candidatus Micrarchaeaceae archaeon]